MRGVVVSLDAFLSASSAMADVVLPAAVAGEKGGTTTNLEGRVTTVSQRVTPAGTARADWMVAAELADALGLDTLADRLLAVDVDHRRHRIDGAGLRRGHPRPRSTATARASSPSARRPAPTSIEAITVTERNSYDYRLVVSRTMYDQAVRRPSRRRSPRWRPRPRRMSARPTPTASA